MTMCAVGSTNSVALNFKRKGSAMRYSRKKFFGVVARATAGTALASAIGERNVAAQRTDVKPKKLEGAAIKGATAAVVRYITTTNLSAIPQDVDSTGQALSSRRLWRDPGGLHGAWQRDRSRVRESSRDRKEATAFGRETLMAPAALAALANGASGHAMDYDDTQLSTTPDRTFGLLTHPTVPPLAASLALSERMGLSGAAFLEAFLIGFEVECKIAEAIDPHHYNRRLSLLGDDRDVRRRRGGGETVEAERTDSSATCWRLPRAFRAASASTSGR